MRKAVKILLVLVLFFPSAYSQSQDIRPVNFRKIKKEIKKKRSPYYYPNLYKRYLELDTSLNVEEFRHLYYGFTFRDDYYPYSTPALQDSLISYLQRPEPLQAEMEVAGRLAGELLRNNPFRLRETFIAAVSYEMGGRPEMSAIYFDFFEKQVEAIMSSGDGLSAETAFVVIYVRDEYEILEVLGLSFGGRQSLSGNCDILELAPNELGIPMMYFNVSRLLQVGFR